MSERSELEAELKRLRKKRRKKALEAEFGRRAAKAEGPLEKAKEALAHEKRMREAGLLDEQPFEPTVLDRLTAINQGQTWGWGDELGVGVDATADWLTNALGKDAEWGDIYDIYKDIEATSRQRYAEERPWENVGLGVGGALTTAPLGIRTMAGKGVLPFMSRLGAAGAEGAIAGYGSTEGGVEERSEGAVESALLGSALRSGMSGLGTLGGAIAKRRVAADIGKGPTFRGILGAEPGQHRIFENYIAPAFGSKVPKQMESIIPRQMPTLEEAVKKAELAKKAAQTLEAQNTRALKQAVRRQKTSQLKAVEGDYGTRKAAAQDKVMQEVNELDLRLAEDKARIRDMAGRAQTDIQEGLQDVVTVSSVPSNMPDDLVAMLGRASDNHERYKILNDFWQTRGFDYAKNRPYRINPETVTDDVLLELGPGTDDFSRQVVDTLQEKVTSRTWNDTISGEDIIEARNAFRRQINAMRRETADTSRHRAALRKAADYLDNQIKDQLAEQDPRLVEQFDMDRKAWGNYQTKESAVGASTVQRGGEYGPEDVLQGKLDAQRRATLRGEADLQSEARTAQQQLKTVQEQLPSEIEQLDDLAKAEKARLQMKRGFEISDAEDARRLAREGVTEEAEEQLERITRSTEADKLKVSPYDEQIETAKDAVKALRQAVPSDKPFNKFAATAVTSIPLGMVGGPLLGGAASIPTAAMMVKALTSEVGQRAYAGQTAPQEALRKVLENKELMRAIERSIRRGTVTATQQRGQ